MATYTLSHTGAEVDAAVNNATNLFTTAHTWTAEQIFTNLTIQTGGLTVAEITTNEATIKSLRVEGAGAFASFGGGVVFNDYVTIESTGSLQVNGVANFAQNIIVTGDVTAGSATIGGETDISGDLIVNGLITAGDATITSELSVGSLLEVGGDVQATGTVYANMFSALSFRIPSRILVEFVAASVTAAHDGVYIASNASALTPFSSGATIPAGVLVIYFL